MSGEAISPDQGDGFAVPVPCEAPVIDPNGLPTQGEKLPRSQPTGGEHEGALVTRIDPQILIDALHEVPM